MRWAKGLYKQGKELECANTYGINGLVQMLGQVG